MVCAASFEDTGNQDGLDSLLSLISKYTLKIMKECATAQINYSEKPQMWQLEKPLPLFSTVWCRGSVRNLALLVDERLGLMSVQDVISNKFLLS